MLQAVINKDSLMRGGLCGKLHVGRSLCCSHCSSHDSNSQIFVENRDFCLSHLHSTPHRNIAMTFGVEKLE